MLSQVTKHIGPVVLNFPVWPFPALPETTAQSRAVADTALESAELQAPPALRAATT
jgi:hypothetical protein